MPFLPLEHIAAFHQVTAHGQPHGANRAAAGSGGKDAFHGLEVAREAFVIHDVGREPAAGHLIAMHHHSVLHISDVQDDVNGVSALNLWGLDGLRRVWQFNASSCRTQGIHHV